MRYKELEPQAVFRSFYEINQIPRCSGHEEAVSNYIKNWASALGLEVKQDHAYNLIIRKDGTPGYEGSAPIIIQGHLDMVCDKTPDSTHCFEKDPISLLVDGDRVKADRTTLGADNGIAVAYAMALLESNDIPHPPLEVLLTTNEESGMDGARAVLRKDLTGNTLINLDAEEEGVFLVGCSGGVRVDVAQDLTREEAAGLFYTITVGGLKGGHSGSDIHLERGNANRILATVLCSLKKSVPFRLADFTGGSKTNAIPRDAKALIVFDPILADTVRQVIDTASKEMKNEFRASDPGLWITGEAVSNRQNAWSAADTDCFLRVMTTLPSGLLHRSVEISGLTETSCNLGVVTTETATVTCHASIRSSVTSRKWKVVDQFMALGALSGARINVLSDYPPWEYRPKSRIRDIFVESYKTLFGKDPVITAIHAGLECGLFTETLGEMDMIAIGPNLYNVHSPEESMSISSVAHTWELLKEVFKRLK